MTGLHIIDLGGEREVVEANSLGAMEVFSYVIVKHELYLDDNNNMGFREIEKHCWVRDFKLTGVSTPPIGNAFVKALDGDMKMEKVDKKRVSIIGLEGEHHLSKKHYKGSIEVVRFRYVTGRLYWATLKEYKKYTNWKILNTSYAIPMGHPNAPVDDTVNRSYTDFRESLMEIGRESFSAEWLGELRG